MAKREQNRKEKTRQDKTRQDKTRKGREGKGREGKGREGKGRLDYTFWRQFDEKPSIIPGCPGMGKDQCEGGEIVKDHCLADLACDFNSSEGPEAVYSGVVHSPSLISKTTITSLWCPKQL